MRGRIGVLLAALTALAGCASTGNSPGQAPAYSPVASADQRADVAACRAVRQIADTLDPDVLDMSNERLARKTQAWASSISRAARGASDGQLRTSLLSLADVVRGWSDRAPDRTALRSFDNDLSVACRPYLNGAGASAS